MKFNKVSKHASKRTFKKAPKPFMKPIAPNASNAPSSTYEASKYACTQAELISIVKTLLTSST